jgi:hypothetical protein
MIVRYLIAKRLPGGFNTILSYGNQAIRRER